MDIEVIIKLLFIHWVADFVMQSDKMAKNKSTSNKWLLLHILAYTLPFTFIGLKFAIANGVLHFTIDYFTSRLTSKLWAKGDVHNFFVVIGFDQFLHIALLFYTYDLLNIGVTI